ncbi:MAG TPA: ATP-binding protein, partial [Cyclobacteriaceae bacterium]|nr:ATP-binding protein [Cyclobacteriaceae bacterium]
KNIVLHYTIDESLNKILMGDPVRLNQVLINLISNAVKFTHTGSIHVTCELEKEQKGICHVRISVKDTGVGIPAEKLNTIFESFSQADESVTRRYGGTGLGLTIARQLVELQKGKIDVYSQEHVGSTFTVHIPYATGSTKASRLASQHVASNLAITTQHVRVLLVEDNDINRLYAKSILQTWKCSTDIAENGLVAIEKLKSNAYDVILMDVQMPVMDGYEATKAIRLMPHPAGATPIVALTANATKIDVEKCLAAGMNDYLSKPFTPEDLYHMLFEKLKVVPGSVTEVKIPSINKRYNLDYLQSMSGNNQEFIREMIQTFVQSIPGSLQEMEEALNLSDFSRLARVTHQIKPSMTLLGIDPLKDLAVQIEELAKKSKAPSLELQLHVVEFTQTCLDIINDLTGELRRF